MTKKDYQAIAAVLAQESCVGVVRTAEDHACASAVRSVLSIVSMRLADHMQRGNPRFNRALFLRACGVMQ